MVVQILQFVSKARWQHSPARSASLPEARPKWQCLQTSQASSSPGPHCEPCLGLSEWPEQNKPRVLYYMQFHPNLVQMAGMCPAPIPVFCESRRGCVTCVTRNLHNWFPMACGPAGRWTSRSATCDRTQPCGLCERYPSELNDVKSNFSTLPCRRQGLAEHLACAEHHATATISLKLVVTLTSLFFT